MLERELLADAYRLSHGLDIADSTRAAYLSDWADLVSFLTTHRLPAQLPIHHALVVLYLSYLAHHGTLMATIDRRLAAIRFIHEQARTVKPASDSSNPTNPRRSRQHSKQQPARNKTTRPTRYHSYTTSLDVTGCTLDGTLGASALRTSPSSLSRTRGDRVSPEKLPSSSCGVF